MHRAIPLSRVPACPFLKWAGGKGQLLSEILPELPDRIDTYFEPFIGGGAVFFALANERRFRSAVIADRNPHLVEVYRVLRDQVGALISLLSRHGRRATDPDYYYRLRGVDPRRLSPVERAARLIFLNKTCYNGLYRVNRRGEFNVPFGRYANPKVCNVDVLEAASHALAGVQIVRADFEVVARRARRGDAVYFDPPYVPVSPTSSFTSYDRSVFGPKEHERLAGLYRACVEREVSVVLSNSDCPLTRSLFSDFEVRTVSASRAINSIASKRGRITEILVVGARRETRARAC